MGAVAARNTAQETHRETARPPGRRRGPSFEGRLMAPALALLALLSIFPFLSIIGLWFSRVGLLGGISLTEIDWGRLTAIGTIVVAPMIVVGLIVRKWLVTGLTLGAVTGE